MVLQFEVGNAKIGHSKVGRNDRQTRHGELSIEFCYIIVLGPPAGKCRRTSEMSFIDSPRFCAYLIHKLLGLLTPDRPD